MTAVQLNLTPVMTCNH